MANGNALTTVKPSFFAPDQPPTQQKGKGLDISVEPEELALQTATSAGIGFALGGVPGAAVGALFGALSYLGGAYAAKAAYGLGFSPETSKMIGRAVEVGIGLLEPVQMAKPGTFKAVREVAGELLGKMPETLKLGMKGMALASTTYYIVEPHYEDEEGKWKPLGIASLIGLGWMVAHEHPELGKWLAYTVRSTLAERWPEKFPSVLIREGEEFRLGPIRGPKLRPTGEKTALGTPKLAVQAVDPFEGVSEEIREKLGPVLELLSEAAASLKAIGVEPFSEASIKAGRFVQSEEALNPDTLIERLSEIVGDRDKAYELLKAVSQVSSAEMLKAGLFQQLGGVAESYLRMLQENRLAFLHRFGLKLEKEAFTSDPAFLEEAERLGWNWIEEELASGQRKRRPSFLPKSYLKRAISQLRREYMQQIYQDIQEKGLEEAMRKWSRRFPSLASYAEARRIAGRGPSEQLGLRMYGTTLPRVREAPPELQERLTQMTGLRRKQDIPEGLTIELEGRKYVWARIREDEKPRWLYELEEGPHGQTIVFSDLAGSVFRTMREDAKTVRKLIFYDWLRKAAEPLGLVSSAPKHGFVKLGEELERQGAMVFKRFGTLTNMWVHPDVERAVRAWAAMEDYVPQFKTLATLNRIWKYGYLALNLKSYVNAFLGNMVLSFANDMDPATVMYKGLRGLRGEANAALLAEAKKLGVMRKELDIERELVLRMRETEQKLAMARSWNWRPSKMKRLLEATEDFVSGKLIRLYSHIDDIFRLGAFLHLVEDRGLPAEEAASLAKRAYGYFEDMPVVVRTLRDTVAPFISFQFRIFPQLLKTFIDHPLRYAGIALFVEGLQRAAFKETYGENWEEGMRLEELVNQAYMKPRVAGLLADFVRVPKLGNVLPGGYMYVGFLPWNIPLSIPQLNTEVGGITAILPMMLVQNPLIRFVAGLTFHIDPATGRKVYKMAGPGRPLASAIQYGLRVLAPSPGINHWIGQLFAKEGWLDPIISWFNYYGTYPDGQPVGTVHMIWNAIMPSILSYDPKYNTEMALYRLRLVEEEARRQLEKAARRGAPMPLLMDRLEDLEQVYDQTWKQKMEILEKWSEVNR